MASHLPTWSRGGSYEATRIVGGQSYSTTSAVTSNDGCDFLLPSLFDDHRALFSNRGSPFDDHRGRFPFPRPSFEDFRAPFFILTSPFDGHFALFFIHP